MRATTSSQLFRTVLIQGAILTVAIAIVGGLVAFLAVGMPGLISALIGSAIALTFTSLTAIAVWVGGKLPLGGFYGLVLGGWLAKVIVFVLILSALNRVDGLNRPTIFFTIVASVLGGLAIDAVAVLRSRVPVVQS
ncbi:MAG: hypothetical protein RL719_1066 [Actinomycetota bacterium]|jgi:hypothetical protein